MKDFIEVLKAMNPYTPYSDWPRTILATVCKALSRIALFLFVACVYVGTWAIIIVRDLLVGRFDKVAEWWENGDKL